MSGPYSEWEQKLVAKMSEAELRENHLALRKICMTEDKELVELFAPLLGYRPYEPGEPGYSVEQVNYVTGDHTGMSLAMEAAKKLDDLMFRMEQLEK